MDGLIKRLREATGASRELDAEIAKEIGWRYEGEDWISPSGQRELAPPLYTYLPDSALAILGYGQFSIEVHGSTATIDGHRAQAATPAIALCIAALLSRAG
jgi:hypothetical protein